MGFPYFFVLTNDYRSGFLPGIVIGAAQSLINFFLQVSISQQNI